MNLAGKIALVTGGTGALGSVIAKRLMEEGAHVFVTYRSEKELGNVQDSSGKKISALTVDATNEQQVVELYSNIISKHHRIDIVVNTVGGFLPQKNITEVSLHEWNLMMDINLKSAFLS
ncbi:MAG: SDR family NAD(P)-dependent oxidoreductase, partial [Ignavibacteriales bacterium]|nr:SDR family NAD(P)-dependent oxidoreductase [Ignavibacteriales bacterium]